MDFIKHEPAVFLNTTLRNTLNFTPYELEFFLNRIQVDEASMDQIRQILDETKRLPAALGPHHGNYEGGLYDHIL